MQCAKGPFAKRPPVDWDRIQKECPNIVRKVQDNITNSVFTRKDYDTNTLNHKIFIDKTASQNNVSPYFKEKTNYFNNNNTELKSFNSMNDSLITTGCCDSRPKYNFKKIARFFIPPS